MVIDPLLAKHLAHFGIDIMRMEKVLPSEGIRLHSFSSVSLLTHLYASLLTH